MMKQFGKKIIQRLLHKTDAKSTTQAPIDCPKPLSITHSHLLPVNYSPSYINRLPVELLQQIFLLIVNDITDYPSIFLVEDTTISVNFTTPPLVFTRVCCLWRVIAHSTPGVWSRIQVVFPGRAGPLKPFFPSLLQAWLARSGTQPLTLRIVSNWHSRQHHFPRHMIRYFSEADSQLFKILLSESQRWECVALMVPMHEWGHNFDTPQLRTLQCCLPDLSRFNAPNLSRLCTRILYSVDTNTQFNRTPTYNNICHLHLPEASAHTMRKTLAMFSHLETIVVDVIISHYGDISNPITNSCLQSMTLPLAPDSLHALIEVFDGLQLPKLQRLTVVGKLNQAGVDCIMAVLAAAACNVQVIDLHRITPLGQVDVDIVELLLSEDGTTIWEALRCPVP